MKPSTRIAVALLMVWVAVVLITPWLGGNGNVIELERILEGPSLTNPMGFDDLGRSIAARIGAGARLSFTIAFIVVAVTALIGTLIGVIAAWLGGWFDVVAVATIDVFLAFPGILLAIALSGTLGPGIFNLVLALSAVGWVGFARLARAQTLGVKQRDHLMVARSLGCSPARIVRDHVLPLIGGPLIVEASFALAAVIIAEAGLSFLGLGVQPPTPSWGSMIRDGTRYMLIAPHFVLMPGLALMSVVVAINVLGDRLRDRWASDLHQRGVTTRH